MADPLEWLAPEAEARRRRGLERRLVACGRAEPGRIEIGGRTLVNFASNDYLGLANDPRVVAAACEAAEVFGWGASASPVICGWRAPHEELARALAHFEGTEAALLFPTGYAANLGTIAALVGPGDAVFLDRLNHSCLVAGARLSGARVRVYPHNDVERLASVLGRERASYRRVLIATDGVFSMDGDLAPLPQLVDIAARFDAMLLVDEAHGSGVFGPDGRGAASALGVADRVPIRVGTLSKALGSVGGFVAGSHALIEHLIHAAPSWVYSTAAPPAAAAAALRALQVLSEEPWRRERLAWLGRRLRSGLEHAGRHTTSPEGPIVPLIVGDEREAVRASAALRERGFLVPAIRPPTVPRGTARLRISLSAAHREEDIDALIAALCAGRR